MPHVTSTDGVKLYYEEAGSGLPVIFVHEFAGDYRSYEAQLRYFSRRFRCIAYNARGYPPSEVPTRPDQYSQERARRYPRRTRWTETGTRTRRGYLDGSFRHAPLWTQLSRTSDLPGHWRLRIRRRASQARTIRGGIGSRGKALRDPRNRGSGRQLCNRTDSSAISKQGSARMGRIPGDAQQHSPPGSALTLRGVQKRRLSLYDLIDKMKRLSVPTLLMTGDEDDPCLEASLMMKRAIPSAGLVVLPRTGHALNLEEPALFNRFVDEFFHQVESGRWTLRDPVR